MEELGKKKDNRRLYNGNQSAIHLENNLSFHLNTKHIQLKYHFITFVLEDELLKLEKIHTSQNPTNMLKKVLTREKLSSCSIFVVLQA